MLEQSESLPFEIHCARCSARYPFVRGDRIVCGVGHELATGFPDKEFWDFCCDCNTFSPPNESGEAEEACLICGRKIGLRFLCDHCNVMSTTSGVPHERSIVTFTDESLPSPFCAGCQEQPTGRIRLHECYGLWVPYMTARSACPFCPELSKQCAEDLRIESKSGREVQVRQAFGTNEYNFTVLDSIAKSEKSIFGWRSYLPKSQKGWLELFGVVTGFLTVVGVVLAMFPSVPAAIVWRAKRAFKSPMRLGQLEFNRYALRGQMLPLSILVDDPEGGQLTYKWSCSAGARIEGTGASTTLNTQKLEVGSIPVEVTLSVRVSDEFGDTESRHDRVTILPPKMANNPPSFKIRPRCNCTSLEVGAGETISFYALAWDPDQQETLTYEWQSSLPAAQIVTSNSDSGSTAILNTHGINPRSTAVPVKISLRVSDRDGGEVVDSITIIVLPKEASANRVLRPISPPNHSPKLEALTVDKTSIEAGESVRLWALATDSDRDQPLFFDWKASAGEILNKGETAVLTTVGVPPSNIIVVLTVGDMHGGSTSQRVFVTVRPPSATPTP